MDIMAKRSTKVDKHTIHPEGWVFFVHLVRSMPTTSLGGSKYVMICVDDFSRFKIVRFLNKSDAAAALRSITTEL